MTLLDLIGQEDLKDIIWPKVLQLKDAMDLRLPIWQKLPPEKKIAWVLSDNDPIMGIAWTIYKYLRNNFFGPETDQYL